MLKKTAKEWSIGVIMLCLIALAGLIFGIQALLKHDRVHLTGYVEKTVSREDFVCGAASYFLPGDCGIEAAKAVCVIVSTRLERSDATGFADTGASDTVRLAARECGDMVLLSSGEPVDTSALDARELCRLAEDGYTYIELLGHLYPGAVLTVREK